MTISIPGAPTSLTVTESGPLTNNVVTVTWTAPSETVIPAVLDYQLEYQVDPSGPWNIVPSAGTKERSVVIRGLPNMTTYNFRVAAINKIAMGPYSSLASITLLSTPGAILPPIDADGNPEPVELTNPETFTPDGLLDLYRTNFSIAPAPGAPEGFGTPPTLPTWENIGQIQYDYALTGVDDEGDFTPIPLLNGASEQYPYFRETAEFRKDQIDTTREPGEQSLQNWWVRAQSSFDLGAGIKFMDPLQEPLLSRRFADSCGVDTFTPGEVTLLRKTNLLGGGTKTSPDSGFHLAVGFRTNGNPGLDGFIYTKNNIIRFVRSGDFEGRTSERISSLEDSVRRLTSDGGAYYAATSKELFRGTFAKVDSKGKPKKIYTLSGRSTTSIAMGHAKESLLVGANKKLWRLDPNPTNRSTWSVGDSISAANAPTQLIWEHPAEGWRWTAIADGPTAVYAAGYSGDYSAVYATGLTTSQRATAFNASSPMPELSTPVIVAELPRGERILSMIVYLGTYAIIGTNIGVRVAIIDNSGNFILGPLTLKSDAPVFALYARDNFVWASGCVSSKQVRTDGSLIYEYGEPRMQRRTGLYRIDISKTLGQNSLTFPWARDIYLESQPAENVVSVTSEVHSIVPLGTSGRVAFTVNNIGLVAEDQNFRVDNGWIETGNIRYDTTEEKIFQNIRTMVKPSAGKLSVAWKDEEGKYYSTGTTYSTSVKANRIKETHASEHEPHYWAAYRFTLYAPSTPTGEGSPTFLGYQLRAQPASVRQRNIRITTLCMPRETTVTGQTVERSVRDRIRALERAEERNAVVRFQDLGTGENRLCLIDKVQFVANSIPETPFAKSEPGGLLIITLRTVS